MDWEGLATELGATVTLLRDRYGQSQAASARRMELSPAAVSELVSRAHDHDVKVVDPLHQIVRVRADRFPQYLRDRGDRIDRIVAAFESNDIPFAAGIHPLQFQEPGGHLWITNMVVHLEAGDEWIGIRDVNVGYGGAGPGAACDLLHRDLGLDHKVVGDIVEPRFADVDFRTGRGVLTDDWPRYHLSSLRGHHGLFLSTSIGIDQTHDRYGRSRTRTADDPTSFLPTTPDGMALERWIDLLDSQPECTA